MGFPLRSDRASESALGGTGAVAQGDQSRFRPAAFDTTHRPLAFPVRSSLIVLVAVMLGVVTGWAIVAAI